MSWIVLPVVLLYLCSPGTSGHGSDHLCMQRRYWRDLMPSLESLNPAFSAACRGEYDVRLEFPVMLNPVKKDKAAVTLQVLEEILRLFRKSTVPWTNSKFLNQVYQVIYELQNCMTSSDLPDVHRSTIKARFANLEGFLNEKDDSICAWEIVHLETRKILQEVSRNHARK